MSGSPYVGFGDSSGFDLRFTATQAEPQFAKLFLATGGAINAAAGPGATDFGVSGSKEAVSYKLKPATPTEICIPLSNEIITFDDDDRIVLNTRTKLSATAQRVGAAINGTIVNTFAGAGSVYLSNFLQAASISEGSHYQLPLTYNTLASHSATVGCSMARICDASGEPVNVHFIDDAEENEISSAAEGIIDKWAQKAWNVREQQIIYAPSPTLTKTVAKVTVGTNDKGYSMAHAVIARPFPFGLETLNSLFEHTISAEMGFSTDEQKTFLNATSKPGVAAADWAQTVAAACSVACAYLVPYRADGRTTITNAGAAFSPVENWRPVRSPEDGEDCDGSAMLAISMLNTAAHASDEEKALYPYVKAVSNVVSPYYSVAMSVVGAASAEASGAADGNSDAKSHIAGHAIAIMIPNATLLRGMESAEQIENLVHGETEVGSDVVTKARFGALFSDRATRKLPEQERTLLAQGPEALEQIRGAALVPTDTSAAARISRLAPFAIEGTTPASPVLYLADKKKRERAEQTARYDDVALEKATPNIARSVKLLHVGGRGEGHRFYHDLVEATLPLTSPLYTDAGLRAIGKAGTQLVFVGKNASSLPAAAGVTPKQLAEGDFGITPLYTVDTKDGAVLDYDHRISERDVMPNRTGAHKLTETQSKALKTSLASLGELNTSSCDDEFEGAHAVTYHMSFSTLANNPEGVKHFVDQVKKARVGSLVDTRVVKGLAVNNVGADAGYFVLVNAVIPV